MTVWDELQVVLGELRKQQPNPVGPMGAVDEGSPPPYWVWLAAWAEPIAEKLHEQFGDNVVLKVGNIRYPPSEDSREHRGARPTPEMLNPDEIAVELDGPAVVRPGHTLRHGLLVHNLSDHELKVLTSGDVFGAVVDPRTG